MAVEPTLTMYTALDLFTWFEEGSLKLSPKFQRRDVWKPAARAYLIDTLLRTYPVPPIHLRVAHDPETNKIVREIIDGQQRLRSLFEFMRGQFKLNKRSGAAWAGKVFSELSPTQRDTLLFTKFHTYQYQGLSDEDALEIFARINTYSVAMNRQELRNGRYFGEFKASVYKLGLEHLEFWRSSRIFSESSIARMSEAELVSELLIVQLDGLQDKKASIDEFYKNLDDSWGTKPQSWTYRDQQKPHDWLSRTESERRFNAVMKAIRESVGDELHVTAFQRVPLFYSLYCAIYHRLFQLPYFTAMTPRSPLTGATTRGLRAAVVDLSEMLYDAAGSDIDRMPAYQRDFVIAASRQTDNLAPRKRRLEIIWRQAGLGVE